MEAQNRRVEKAKVRLWTQHERSLPAMSEVMDAFLRVLDGKAPIPEPDESASAAALARDEAKYYEDWRFQNKREHPRGEPR